MSPGEIAIVDQPQRQKPGKDHGRRPVPPYHAIDPNIGLWRSVQPVRTFIAR